MVLRVLWYSCVLLVWLCVCCVFGWTFADIRYLNPRLFLRWLMSAFVESFPLCFVPYGALAFGALDGKRICECCWFVCSTSLSCLVCPSVSLSAYVSHCWSASNIRVPIDPCPRIVSLLLCIRDASRPPPFPCIAVCTLTPPRQGRRYRCLCTVWLPLLRSCAP